MIKIVTIVGARPQFIKAAVVSRAIAQHNECISDDSSQLNEIIIHTGQHYDRNMSDVFFDEMHIPRPDYFLNVKDLSHGAMTGQMLEKIEAVLLKEKPDIVLIYGDTNTTLAGALAATKIHIPAAHVEAGLRSFNRLMPEEINRVLTDHVSNILFCPTVQAVENLRIEGIQNDNIEPSREISILTNSNQESSPSKPLLSVQQLFQSAPGVALVGDVMLDAALYYRKFAQKPEFDYPKFYILATIHRAENTDNVEQLKSILGALQKISREIAIVLPLHPRTRKKVQKLGLEVTGENILLTEPVSYLNMVYLLERCRLVLTDSGGLQKEAYFFKKPCVTLRDETEWVELVDNGFNYVAGTGVENIYAAFKRFIEKEIDFNQNLYGDGLAGEKIVKIICENLSVGSR
jgi:UDP-GlcNAc3NAcA epimerase